MPVRNCMHVIVFGFAAGPGEGQGVQKETGGRSAATRFLLRLSPCAMRIWTAPRRQSAERQVGYLPNQVSQNSFACST